MTPIYEHALVDLVLADTERHAARVRAVGRRHLLLTLFDRPTDAEVGPDFRAAALEHVAANGLSRLGGSVAFDYLEATFKPAEPAALLRRRNSPRVELDRGVLLGHGAAAASVAGWVLDISAGGMRFGSADSFALGEDVQVTFAPDGAGEPLYAMGRVVRVQGDGQYALAFADGRDGDPFRVDRLIRSARPRM